MTLYQELLRREADAAVLVLAFAPNGRTGLNGGTALLWDVGAATGRAFSSPF
jgi:hypothetical protein